MRNVLPLKTENQVNKYIVDLDRSMNVFMHSKLDGNKKVNKKCTPRIPIQFLGQLNSF